MSNNDIGELIKNSTAFDYAKVLFQEYLKEQDINIEKLNEIKIVVIGFDAIHIPINCLNGSTDEVDFSKLQFAFNKDFLKSHIDVRDVKNYAEDFFKEDIYNYPEAYFDDSERMLSRKQREQLDILFMKMSRLKQSVQQFEQRKEGPNAEWFNKKISEFEEIIDEYSIEITEIQDDPEGDFPDELMDDMLETKLNEVDYDPWNYIEAYDVNWEQFVDEDTLVEDAIETEGYGHFLAQYDGEAHEVYADGDLFYVMRID
jgi:hypothetical protein